MNVVLTVLEIVAPVFLLGLVGFTWVRLGFDYRIEFITRLSMTLGVPCLIFTALMNTEIDPAALSTLSVATLVAYSLVAVLATALVLAARLDTRTFLSPIIFGNTGNIGLPLALFAFGAEGLGFAVVVFAVMAVLSFTAGLWVVAGGGNPLRVIKEPIRSLRALVDWSARSLDPELRRFFARCSVFAGSFPSDAAASDPVEVLMDRAGYGRGPLQLHPRSGRRGARP